MSSRRNAIEHAQSEQQRDDARTRSERIEDLIKRCSRALSRGQETGERHYYRYVAETMRDDLVGLVDEHSSRSFVEYDARLGDHDGWDWMALSSFLGDPDAYVRRLSAGGDLGGRSLSLRRRGLVDEDTAAVLTVKKALESLAAIAEDEKVVLTNYSSRVDAYGFAVKIGENLQAGDMDMGDPVHAVSWQTEGLKTLHAGGTGYAKSSGLEREAEDFYLYHPDENESGLDHHPPGEFKLLDLADLGNGENWFYDVPQQQHYLRELRKKQDLPPDFTEADEPIERRVEIFAPLTPALNDVALPYDTERDEWTVRPFVIPASDIPKGLLMAAIAARVSPREMRTIRQAYDDVANERTDWGLVHLAESIYGRDDLSDNNKANAIGVIRSLQNEGFIRTERDGPTLDWEAIFRDTDTITIFTQAETFVDTEIGQFIAVAYLLDKLLRLRSGSLFQGLPEAVLLVRELWKIVPHSGREVTDDRAKAIQRLIGDLMARALRENRKFRLNVIADTQKPYDLKNSVREMFNRYVVYSGTNRFIEGAFSWTQNSKHKSFRRTITAKRGQASIVGEVQPAIEKSWIEYLPPVDYAPPSHHHWDKNVDDSGWQARVKYLDHEEARQPEWDVDLPDALQITGLDVGEDDEDEDDEADADPRAPHRMEARNRKRDGQSIREIRDGIPNNPDTGNPYSTFTIHKWTEDIEKGAGHEDREEPTESGEEAAGD